MTSSPPRGWALRTRLRNAFVAFALVVIVAAVASVIALSQVVAATDAQVSRYDPARLASQNLLVALVDQETGVRGYALSRNEQFLQPYQQGLTDEQAAIASLRGYFTHEPALDRDLDTLLAAAASWQKLSAEPTIAQTKAGDPTASSVAANNADKARFDQVRAASSQLSNAVGAARARAHSHLRTTITVLVAILGVLAAAMVAVGVLAWIALRRWILSPLDQLGTETRTVAAGDFEHVVVITGQAELRRLGEDVEAMRARITTELVEVEHARSGLAQQSAALERSNADLEQFAYVASHDLQEPLRKVANFCQLLARQYEHELDERGHQYIDYAVDGARRMQVLIQDLLAFSRVGRTTHRFEPVGLSDAAGRALATLEPSRTTPEATVTIDAALPVVDGDESLLVTLFQNLIGNSLKYRSDRPPLISIKVADERERTDGEFTIVVTDNGIGIDAVYSERIFVIFQRLHLRDQYSGTGIGLAVSKKIVEYHGGRIWLDTSYTGGARFYFTLPERRPQ